MCDGSASKNLPGAGTCKTCGQELPKPVTSLEKAEVILSFYEHLSLDSRRRFAVHHSYGLPVARGLLGTAARGDNTRRPFFVAPELAPDGLIWLDNTYLDVKRELDGEYPRY